MLICNVTEQKGVTVGEEMEDNSTEFQMADEMYKIAATNSAVDGDRDKTLTTSDLVILYKNIDIDTKLVPNANQLARKTPNQYVETVIYNDDRRSEGSDVSEDFTYEDFNHVFAVNNERIGFLNNYGDTLCHKCGDIKMRTSGLTTEYDKHFLFNDYIQDQLKNLHPKSEQSESTILPTSLLDYICCKRLEDNCNLYMDNIIKYVQNTIEQLKRISNGDYLTGKAKAKWREGGTENRPPPECKNTVLASPVTHRIALDVPEKRNPKVIWDDVVHSEMDVRSLCKILEKKIIVEIPKIICGTYRLFSKRYKQNFIITCKKDKRPEKESRVDVLLKLHRSEFGHIISNIDSIFILESSSAILTKTDPYSTDLLAIDYKKDETIDEKIEVKDIDLNENYEEPPSKYMAESSVTEVPEAEELSEDDCDLSSQYNCYEDNDNVCVSSQAEFDNGIEATVAVDDLHCVIQRLSMQSPVIEEKEEILKKKKSPIKVRIKSPYENKSYVLDEKKRKKLLEVREKREVKKNAIVENRKITKSKRERSTVTAQSSNSVTTLSITNKHFYNSIYGDCINIIQKKSRKYYKDLQNDNLSALKLQDDEKNHYKEPPPAPLTTPKQHTEKYSNPSYYLDDVDTEVMHLEMKQCENQINHSLSKVKLSTPTAANEIDVNLDLHKQLIVTSTTDSSLSDTFSRSPALCDTSYRSTNKENIENNILTSTQSIQVVLTNPPKKEVFTETKNCNPTSSVECRRSIDKIYDLIKKISDSNSLASSKTANNIAELDHDDSEPTKHPIASSNSGCFTLEKVNTVQKSPNKKHTYDNSGHDISKITISSKSQSLKMNNASDNQNGKLNLSKIQDNPLKAISELIKKIDSVRKTNNKNENESKKNERLSTEERNDNRRQVHKRMPKDRNLKDPEVNTSKFSVLKERRILSSEYGHSKFNNQQYQSEERSSNRMHGKKIADIIDEVNEMRGEAVRGPPKKLTRLNNLAQPKKTYCETLKEECQNKFGKRVTDRFSKPTSHGLNPDKYIPCVRNKHRKVSEGLLVSTKPLSTGPPLERISRTKSSSQKSPSREKNDRHSPVSVGRGRCNQVILKKIPEVRRESKRSEFCDYNHAGRSKVPLISIDSIESMTSSPLGDETFSVLRNKLHNMIDDVVDIKIPIPLTECKVSISKLGNGIDDDVSTEGRTRSDLIVLSVSDYPLDIFEDKNIITAVSSISKDNRDCEEIVYHSQSKTFFYETNQPNKLPRRNSLYYQISKGEFQKPLKINNTKLDTRPKQSKEKDSGFILTSGDTSPVVLPKLAHMDPTTDTFKENLSEILPYLAKNRLDFGFTKLPMQIATIGYALPHFYRCDSTTKIKLLENNDSMLKNLNLENETNKPFGKSDPSFRIANKELPKDIEKKESVVIKEVVADCEVRAVDEPKKERKRGDNVKDAETPLLSSIKEDKTIGIKSGVDIKNSDISNSTSLDILLSLLNEIKKITSYEANIPKQENISNNERRDTEVEIILNKVAVKESSIDHCLNNAISLPSIHSLQILKACNRNLLYLPSNIDVNRSKTKMNETQHTATSLEYICRPSVKEANTYISTTEYVHRFTETPSRYALLSVSTGATDSLVKIITKSSSLSMYSFNDCDSSNTKLNEIIEVPSRISEENNNVVSSAVVKIEDLNSNKHFADIKPLTEYNYSTDDFDSLMKMKRGILVTFYSILVLTVFTALSFPEIIYRVY
ncbi:uncharacterized protein LOC112046840 isoform X2 [Bicyclus anynana]|uniref:Uncharacterized protein LOC112046840 isoform X2 n=1 Tax=Bicyclus anynana TaxID=110368 RepID=A0A6J1MUS0_BICAN|nr:uncharacterized protein LOC112046840 isoform X2 [Bicyclus anynana]